MPAIGSGQRRGTVGGSKAIEDPHIKQGMMVEAPPKAGSPDVYPGIIILNNQGSAVPLISAPSAHCDNYSNKFVWWALEGVWDKMGRLKITVAVFMLIWLCAMVWFMSDFSRETEIVRFFTINIFV